MLAAVVITEDGDLTRTEVPPRLAVLLAFARVMGNPSAGWIKLGPLTFIPYKDLPQLSKMMEEEIADAGLAIGVLTGKQLDEDEADLMDHITKLRGYFERIRDLCGDATKFEELPVIQIECAKLPDPTDDSDTPPTLH